MTNCISPLVRSQDEEPAARDRDRTRGREAARARRAADGSAKGQAAGPGKRRANDKAADSLPVVPWSELTLLGDLARGRTCSVLEVRWKGNVYAVKQWDVADDDAVARAEREMRMYARLRHLQGTVIPRACFRSASASGGVILLGLQRGTPLPSDDQRWTDAQRSQRAEAVEALRAAGVVQTDDEPRNYVLLRGTDGAERVAVVDLETVRSLPPSPPSPTASASASSPADSQQR